MSVAVRDVCESAAAAFGDGTRNRQATILKETLCFEFSCFGRNASTLYLILHRSSFVRVIYSLDCGFSTCKIMPLRKIC